MKQKHVLIAIILVLLAIAIGLSAEIDTGESSNFGIICTIIVFGIGFYFYVKSDSD